MKSHARCSSSHQNTLTLDTACRMRNFLRMVSDFAMPKAWPEQLLPKGIVTMSNIMTLASLLAHPNHLLCNYQCARRSALCVRFANETAELSELVTSLEVAATPEDFRPSMRALSKLRLVTCANRSGSSRCRPGRLD